MIPWESDMTSDEIDHRPVVPATEIAEPRPAYLPLEEIVYPESDNQPMAETEAHRDEMIDLVQALQYHYRDQDDVYVGGNLFLYYEEGNLQAVVAPDVFVVHGVPKLVVRGGVEEKRRTFQLWQEGRAPSMVIEVTSEHTGREGHRPQEGQVRELGGRGVFLWDPLGGYLKPRLQGFRLLSGAYRSMALTADGSLLSRTTGLTLAVEGNHLRLLVTATGEPLLADRERAAAAQQWAEEEAAARRQAERQAESLRAELARVRAELAR